MEYKSTLTVCPYCGCGCAFYLARKPNNRYDKQLLKAQREAMTAEKGMWRHWQEAGEGYIGNRRSRRFHLKRCPFGQKISRKNRVYFSKRWDEYVDKSIQSSQISVSTCIW